MGGPVPTLARRQEEAISPGYRAQRLVGLFGNPVIAQLMATLAQSRTAGLPNVSATAFAAPGGAPVIDVGVLPPSLADLENAVPVSAPQGGGVSMPPASPGGPVPTPAAAGLVVDPIVAAVLQAFRDLIQAELVERQPERAGPQAEQSAPGPRRSGPEPSPEYEATLIPEYPATTDDTSGYS